jgi:peroxiredoxin
MSAEPPESRSPAPEPSAGEPPAARSFAAQSSAAEPSNASADAGGATPEPPREPPSRLRRFRRYALEAAAVVVIFLLASHFQTRNLVDHEVPAPNLTLRDLDGNVVRLADFRGKRVLLHFWATWCGVCTQEVGALNATFDALPKDEALLTVVADGDDVAAVRKFVAERGVRYPVLLGTDAAVRAFRVSAFPTNYYLSADGRVDSATVGMSSRWGMQARLGCAK